jgi:phosphatidylglycerol:prolipoprotein diacylglycerol transferase
VEFFRQPDLQLGFVAFDWMTMGQVLCLPMIAFGLALLAWSRVSPGAPARKARS